MTDHDLILETAKALIAIPSETPPSDTRAVADEAARILAAIPDVEVTRRVRREPVHNLVAVLRGGRPGRRIVLSGHLDTYPAGDEARWESPPYAPEVRDGRLFGRGSADMKGGIAAAIAVLSALAGRRDWPGEVVLALAGDEESMGRDGTLFLLETVPALRGDACIVVDAGSPAVIRFGEKGMVWLTLQAEGAPRTARMCIAASTLQSWWSRRFVVSSRCAICRSRCPQRSRGRSRPPGT